jgi:hypothetical protein
MDLLLGTTWLKVDRPEHLSTAEFWEHVRGRTTL